MYNCKDVKKCWLGVACGSLIAHRHTCVFNKRPITESLDWSAQAMRVGSMASCCLVSCGLTAGILRGRARGRVKEGEQERRWEREWGKVREIRQQREGEREHKDSNVCGADYWSEVAESELIAGDFPHVRANIRAHWLRAMWLTETLRLHTHTHTHTHTS